MTSRGQFETDKLRQNLENQLNRLVQQLHDLEECKDDLEENEYEETKNETMEQLCEMNKSLSKMMCGDMTLVDHLGSMQLAIQSTIRAAFHTPEVIRLFARREPGQLRERLKQIDRDIKLCKQYNEDAIQEKLSILGALKHLGEQLTPEESHFITHHSLKDVHQFTQVCDSSEVGQKAWEMAGSEVRSMKQK